MFKYKGYSGKVEFDEDDGLFYGRVIDIKDIVTFRGASVKELQKAFRESVDDYLDFCKSRNEKPDKPFSGKFVLRVKPDLHHQLHLRASEEGKSLNAWLVERLEKISTK